MTFTLTILLSFLFVAHLVLSETLMDRITKKLQYPHSQVHERNAFLRHSEGGYQPQSLHEVGSLRGRPIVTRQGIVFDNHGGVIHILPYSDNIRRLHTRPNKYIKK